MEKIWKKWNIEYIKINFKHMEKIKIEQGGCACMFWVAGWLFTIGFLHLAFWKGVLAIVLWPYYIGVFVAAQF